MTEYDDNADNVLGPVLQPPAAPAPYMTEDMMMGGPSMADELASIEQDLNMTRRFAHNEDKARTFFLTITYILRDLYYYLPHIFANFVPKCSIVYCLY